MNFFFHFSVFCFHFVVNVAFLLLFRCSDDAIEAYDVLVALFESELGQLLVSCRAAGIGKVSDQDSGELEHLLGRAYENRLISHTVAQRLLGRRREEDPLLDDPTECHRKTPIGPTYILPPSEKVSTSPTLLW